MMRVLYSQGAQTLYIVPIDLHGKPARATAATYAISDLRRSQGSSDREVVAAGTAATVDSYSQALTATAGAGAADPRKISVASTAGLAVGRQYLLTATNGQRELVTCDSVVADSYIRTRVPLVGTFPVGSTLRGIELAVVFPADEADDEDMVKQGGGPYAIDLVLTGVDRPVMRVFAEIVRVLPDTTACSFEDVLEQEPQAQAILGTRIDPYTPIRAATREFAVRMRLKGVRPETRDGGDATRLIVTYLTCANVLKYGSEEATRARAEWYRGQAESLMLQLVEGQPDGVVVTDESTDTAPPPRTPVEGLFSRF